MSMAGRGLDWAGLMRVGLHGLGLRPTEFWALTPAELAAILGIEASSPPMNRQRLAELEARFPDRPAGADGTDNGMRGQQDGE